MSLNVPKIKVKKLHVDAKIPQRGTTYAAGFDLYCLKGNVIKAYSHAVFETGLAFEIPNNWYGRIEPRSGLSFKNHVEKGAGIIDSDYRGEVKIKLYNFGEEDVCIKDQDRVAQIIFQKVPLIELEEVKELSLTERGENGFGSTGIGEIIIKKHKA